MLLKPGPRVAEQAHDTGCRPRIWCHGGRTVPGVRTVRGGLVARFVGGALLLGVILALVFVVLLVTIGSRRTAVRTAARSADVLTASFQAQKLLLDIETGVRGYLLTRERPFLSPYQAAVSQLPGALTALTQLTVGTASQHLRATGIAAAATGYLNNWARPAVTAGPRAGGRATQIKGKRLVDAIRARFAVFDATQRQVADREAAHASHLATLALILGSVGAAAALVLMTLYALYARSMVAPVRRVARAARRVAEGDLDVRVPDGGTAEVADLTAAFNGMAGALRAGRDELETYNDELEAQQTELQSLLAAVAEEKGRTERLHEFAQALAGDSDLPSVGTTILKTMCAEAQADAGALYAYNFTLDVHQLAATRGVAPEDLAATVRPGRGTAGTALTDRRPITVAPGDAGLPIAVLGREEPARHQLSVPLMLGDRPAGVMTLARAADRPFSEAEIGAVLLRAEQAAVAVARARMQQQTERSLRTVQAVIDATPAPIALVSPAGDVLFENQPMAELREQQGDEPTAARAFDVDGDAGAPGRDELSLDGGRRVLARYTAPLAADGDTIIGRIVVLRDVSAEREAERLKDEFFALVSHELRTPLSSIVGYLELALEDTEAAPLDAQRRQFLEVVDRNAHRLQRLVGDLLFAAQVEAGAMSLERESVDLARLVSEAVEAAAPRADAADVALVHETPDELWLARADGGRLGQMLDNLIANAIKFTPPGGTVAVRCRRADAAAEVTVSDTGMGIAPSDQERLFERFFRAREASERGVPGAGLGLTIVQAIVHGHGGEIEVDSAPGAGTTFRVSIPVRGGGQRVSDPGRRARAGAAPEG